MPAGNEPPEALPGQDGQSGRDSQDAQSERDIADLGEAVREMEASEREAGETPAGGEERGEGPEDEEAEGLQGRIRRALEGPKAVKAGLAGAGIVALGAAWLLFSWPDGGDEAPETAGGRPAATAETAGQPAPGLSGGLTVEEIVREAPELAFQDDPVDFGPAGASPLRATVVLVHERGHRGALAVDRPRISGTGTLPAVVREGGDCLDGPQRPGDAGEWCSLTLEWDPEPGESLDAKLRLRYAPWDDSLEALPGTTEAVAVIERLWSPVEVSVRLVGGAGAVPAGPARLLVEVQGAAPGAPPALDLGSSARVGRESQARADIVVENGPAQVESVRLTGLPPEVRDTLRLDASGCERSYVPGGGTGRDWCEARLSWVPAAEGRLPEGAEMVVTWSRSSGEGPPDRLRAAVPVSGEAGRAPPPLSVLPQAATVREASEASAGPHGSASFTLKAGDSPVSVLSWRLSAPEPPEGTLGPPSATSDCPGERPLEAAEECGVRIEWPALPGARGAASLEVQWRSAQGEGAVQAQVGLDVPKAPTALRDPREELVRRLREEIGGRRGLPALQEGIGVVTVFDSVDARLRGIEAAEAVRTASAQAARAAQAEGSEGRFQAIEGDWSSLGVNPGEGLSSRPVRMEATVLHGTPIRATIAQTFDAKLESPVFAFVEVDVHSAHGRNVVVPRGSRLFGWTRGPQEGESAPGGATAHMLTARQGRISIEWVRLTRPDGTAFRVDGRLRTADLMGRPGVLGRIDHRELERYAQILGTRGFSAAAALLLDIDRSTVTTQRSDDQGRSVQETRETLSPSQQALEELQKGLQEIGGELSALQVPPPTITVPGGTRIVLWPTVDLWLRRGRQPPAEAPQGGAADLGGLSSPLPPSPAPSRGPEGSGAEAQEGEGAPSAPPRRTRRPLTAAEIHALSESQGGGTEISAHGLDSTGLEGTRLGDGLRSAAGLGPAPAAAGAGGGAGAGGESWEDPYAAPLPEPSTEPWKAWETER